MLLVGDIMVGPGFVCGTPRPRRDFASPTARRPPAFLPGPFDPSVYTEGSSEKRTNAQTTSQTDFSTTVPPTFDAMTAYSQTNVHTMPLTSNALGCDSAAAARMQSELARAVAAAAAEPSLIAPSFSLASALSGALKALPTNVDSSRSTSPTNTSPGLTSRYGSCDSLCGLGEACQMDGTYPSLHPLAGRLATPALREANMPLAAPSSATVKSLAEVEALAAASLSKRQRMASSGHGRPAASVHFALGTAAAPASRAPSPKESSAVPADLYPSGMPGCFLGLGLGARRRPPSASSVASTAQCASLSLVASPLLSPRQHPIADGAYPPPLQLGTAAASPQLHGVLPASPPPAAPDAQPPQSITVLPGATHALPRIVNLKSGCSDGLALLSATAWLVARDGTSPPGSSAVSPLEQPGAKRART